MATFVNALAIQRWADQADARGMLPQLIRKLATATLNDIKEIRFPALESVQRPGFDGLIVSDAGNAWVPAGKSFWELSVEKKTKAKFDKDYAKRVDEVPLEIRKESTFVFLTPRHRKNKGKWAEDIAKEGAWKDVRAYDCDDVEAWSEFASAVAIWFGEAIGILPPGVDCLSARWKAISGSTRHVLLPDVFVVDRSRTAEALHGWLARPANWLAIASRSPNEVVDFMCAWSASLKDDARSAFESRSVLIEEMGAWKRLRDAQSPLVLIVDPSVELSADEISRALSKGHHVLLAVESSRDKRSQTVELEQPSEFELARALESSGYEPAESEQFARACGGSLAVLKNRLSHFRSISVPTWAEKIPQSTIRASLLLGGWNGSNKSDIAAFEQLSGIPYADSEADLHKLSSLRDSVLLHAAGNWRQVSKDDAWLKFGAAVTPTALITYESLAVEILADDDPKYGLEEKDRITASIQGHVPKYSSTIKKNLAETLALLGTIGETIEAESSIATKATISRIVESVLSPVVTWHRWASLGANTSLLAEASPESFLRAVRADLNKSSPEILKLFIQDGDVLFGNCNHAGILWALETLAWSRKYLPDVAEILLKLADQDPGGKWSNRPDSSLAEILSCRLPHTTATCSERIKILDLLVNRNRDAAWPILLKIASNSSIGIANRTEKPHWQNWAASWSRGVTGDECRMFSSALGSRVVEQAGVDSKRWKEVFDHLGCLADTVRPSLLESARSLSKSGLEDSERQQLAASLSHLINLHRQSDEKDWFFTPEFLEELELLQKDFAPQTEVMKCIPLFARSPEILDRNGSYEENQAALTATRNESIKKIASNEGFSGIVSLAVNSEVAYQVGNSLALATEDEYLNEMIPVQLRGGEWEREFVYGFIWARWYVGGWTWVKSTLASCECSETKSWFLSALPFVSESWNLAKAQGEETENMYWDRCRPYHAQLEVKDVEYAVTNLTNRGRFGQAIDLLSSGLHAKLSIDTAILTLPLEGLMSGSSDQNQAEVTQAIKFGVPKLIEELQSRHDVDETLMFRIEFNFLGLLNRRLGSSPKTLFKHLSWRPELFIEMLVYCYKASNQEDDDQEEDPPVQRNIGIATQIFRLLREWDLIPGTQVDGTIDKEELLKWCREARRLAAECGRLEKCDCFIGQLFAHAPEDADGTWPCDSVRQAIVEIATETLESSFYCGIRNLRGVQFRTAGDDSDLVLANKYRRYAEVIRFQQPFIAGILDCVVESYERDSKKWSERDRWER